MLFLIRVFSLLPLSVLYFLAAYVIYPLVRYVARYRLKLVRKNIRLSFPEKSEKERNRIINAFYHHFADILVEIFYGYRVSDEEMRERVVFENMEVLEDLARQKHGVIAYLGHMCNWEWLADVGKQIAPQIRAKADGGTGGEVLCDQRAGKTHDGEAAEQSARPTDRGKASAVFSDPLVNDVFDDQGDEKVEDRLKKLEQRADHRFFGVRTQIFEKLFHSGGGSFLVVGI